MKLIKPHFEIVEQQAGLEGMDKQIELAGRTCYKSENLITEDSAVGFVERMIANKHYAMLEHGTVYLYFEYTSPLEDIEYMSKTKLQHNYQTNKYSKVVTRTEDYHLTSVYITTNLRVLVENNWLDDLKYFCEPTEYHEKRYCVRFTCDRGVSHEFVRHRVFSFAQESTRYCNYSKDKFRNELTYIIPSWIDINEGQCYWKDGIGYREGADLNNSILGTIEKDTDSQYQFFLHALDYAEKSYFNLLKTWEEKSPDKRYKSGFKGNPWTPQQARAILPNALKTELVMTGFISDWKHFFELRCDKAAHPDAQVLANSLKKEFINRGYIKP